MILKQHFFLFYKTYNQFIMDTLDTLNLPEPKDVSPRNTGLKYGIILALVGLIFQLLMYLMGWADGSSGDPTMILLFNILALGLTIAIITMGVRYHRNNELGGFISFGRAMTVCFWMGLIYGIITAIWGWVYGHIIAPETLENLEKEIEKIRMQVEDGDAPEYVLTIVETTFSFTNNPLIMMIMSLLSILFFGLFVSLFLKRSRPLG